MVVFIPPSPPHSFVGQVPTSVESPLSVDHLIPALLYTYHLGLHFATSGDPEDAKAHANAMIHQTRIANSILQTNHPTDLSTSAPTASDDLVRQISSAVGATVQSQLKGISDRLGGFDARFDDLKKTFQAGKSDLEDRFKTVDERLKGFDERFKGFDERFKGFDERFKGFGERFKGFDERFKTVDEQFGDIKNRLDTISKSTDNRFEAIHGRLEDMNKLIKATDEHLKTIERVQGEHTKQLNEQESNLLELKRSAQKLQRSIDTRPSDESMKAIVQDIAATELSALKTEIRRNNESLAAFDDSLTRITTKVDSIEAVGLESSSNLFRTERTQRLLVNHIRAHNGPWLVIFNENRQDPTDVNHNYPALTNNEAIWRLSLLSLYHYLVFYNLETPVRRAPNADGVPPWPQDKLELARNSLRNYITTIR